MNAKELNKKLAEWAEIRYVKHTVQVCGQMIERYEWHYPDGSFHHCAPDFPLSLDACFKWLVPKYIRALEDSGLHTAAAWSRMFSNWLNNMVAITGENPALALCLAIEKQALLKAIQANPNQPVK
ncbi:hypothetical protein LCGC14_2982290 [marine sediment metagenome]|uniref:Phage ABA sandwich domain-containing protein n=1 Tax=marine sediment metagenome TaxID=412755 RepID=A0A0F8X743_9ZZZZ